MHIPTSYNQAETFLGSRVSRKVRGKRATEVRRVEGGIALYYHQTPVVTWQRDKIVLRTNGHRTVTTKRRINEATRVRVWQRNFDWWVTFSQYANPEPFVEGMVFLEGIPT